MSDIARPGFRRADRFLRSILLTALLSAMTVTAALAATPAFSVHKNGTNQTITASTNTKLTWSTEVFDTNNNFATDRFTPTEAGKYLIVVSARCAQPGMCIPSIYKNGALYAQTQWTNHTFADQAPQATAIIDMNGTTDYVEAFIYSTGTVIGGTSDRTYFSGSQVDGAGSGGGSSQWANGTGGAIYYNGGNVGIGIAAPTGRLHVTGGSALFNTSTNTAPLQIARLNGPTETLSVGVEDAAVRFHYLNDESLSIINFRLQNTDTESGGGASANDNNVMTLRSDVTGGRVGIGTMTPTTNLDVNGDTATTSLSVNGVPVRGIVLMPEVSVGTGTQVDFTSIPSGVSRITVMFDTVSTTGGGELQIQLGTISGIAATGYFSTGRTGSGAEKHSTTACLVSASQAAADVHSGPAVFTRMSGNKWVMSSSLAMNGSSTGREGACLVSLSGLVDRLRVSNDAGDSFDSGSLAVAYE